MQRPVITPHQIVLLGLLLLAFLLPFLTWEQAAGGALLALLFNAEVFPRMLSASGGAKTDGKAFALSGSRAGMILYPVSILILILLFRWHLEVVAAAWAVLALGDAAASIIGRAAGGPRIPWNREKTWSGSAAFVAAATLGAYAILRWVSPHMATGRTFDISLTGSLVGALVESVPVRLDDNLAIPLISAEFIFCALLVERSALASNMPYLAVRLALAITVSAVFSLLALAIRAATASGALAGFFLGIAIYLGYGWKSFTIAALFFVLGSAATRLGYGKKARRGVAQSRGGARSWREALANTLAGAFFSILVILTHHEAAFLAALVAAFAEAAGDTLSSEIGQWLAPRAYLITSWQPVAAGEDGGVSFAGSLAGLAGCSAMVAAGLALRLCLPQAAAIALAAAVAGNILDSLLGATLERRGLVTNSAVNFAATTFAGALALGMMFHFHLG